MRDLPSRRLARLAVFAAVAAVAGPVLAQVIPSSRPRVDYRRKSSAGREFPSWERDVDSDELNELPAAPPGKFVPVFSATVDATPVGVVALREGGFAVALATGAVAFVDTAGSLGGTIDLGEETAFPPSAALGGALVAGRTRVGLASAGAWKWKETTSAPLAVAPAAGMGADVLVALEGGRLESRDSANGAVRWSAPVGAAITAGPSSRPGVVLVGTAEGEIVALDAKGGEVLWRVLVARHVDALAAEPDAVYAAARGPSARTRRGEAPFLMRLTLGAEGRRWKDLGWRLRVGGSTSLPPIFLDEVVAFATGDGYVHAVQREQGIAGWRMDLPSRAQHLPVEAGGRLDFALALTGYLVALGAETGGVMGWTVLPDPDETFAGPAAWSGGVTAVGTSLDRVLGFRWQYDEGAFEMAQPDPLQARPAPRSAGEN